MDKPIDSKILEAASYYKALSEHRSIAENVSPDSFNLVAHSLFGLTVKEAQSLYDDFRRISVGAWPWANKGEDNTVEIISKAFPILEKTMSLTPSDPYRTIDSYMGQDRFDDRNRIGIYFSRNGGTPELIELKLNSPQHLALVSEMEQADDIAIVCIVPWVDSISSLDQCRNALENGQHRFHVYDGDIFLVSTDINRSYWSKPEENGVYVCQWGAYRRVLYTQGRGYLTRDHEANVADDGDKNSKDVIQYGKQRFSQYLLTMDHDWKRIGNIHADISLLQEKKD